MSLDLTLNDLSRLDRVRQVLAENDPKKQFAFLDMKEIHLEENIFDCLLDVVERCLADANLPIEQKIVLRMLVDPVTIKRGTLDLKAEVMRVLSTRYPILRITLDDGSAILHADEHILQEAAEKVVGASCIISVGGGTITDIAKIAAQRSNIPVHIALQTAASVDGYTDNFSVILQNGVKKTLLSRWPEAVLADKVVIASAPQAMNAAGLGELVSMYSAPGDWFLASKLGMDDSFSPVLLDILALCGQDLDEWVGGIAHADKSACARLTAALAMRGIVTGIGGTTAPLSGMEHLFSHMLDMIHGERQEPMGAHGAQVGVGSVIRAAAWEIFCERMQQEKPAASCFFPNLTTARTKLLAEFAKLDASGKLGEECWSRYHKKLSDWQICKPQIEAFFENWDIICAQHDKIAYNSHTIARYLYKAKAPMRYSDLTPKLTEKRMRWVVANCQFMRERFTVADLLTFAGWWDDAGISRVLERVEAACKAAESGE